MAVSNDAFISRLPEADRQAIAEGQAQRAAQGQDTPAVAPPPPATHSTPRQAVEQVHDYAPPPSTQLQTLDTDQQRDAVTTYNGHRAEFAHDAIDQYEPNLEQFSALPPAVAQLEYDSALASFRNDPYIKELQRIETESTSQPNELPTTPPSIDALPGLSAASDNSGTTGNEVVDEALDAVVVARESLDAVTELANQGNGVGRAELSSGVYQAELAAAERELDNALRTEAESLGDPRERTVNHDLGQVDNIVDDYSGGPLGQQYLAQAAERVKTDMRVDDTLERAEAIDDPEQAEAFLEDQAENLGGTAAQDIRASDVYAQITANSEASQTARAAEDFESLPGDITAFAEFDDLLIDNIDSPAYLAEVVRLGQDAGFYQDLNMSTNWLFNRQTNGEWQHDTSSYADADLRREAVVASLDAALQYGVISEADIRDRAEFSQGWTDIAVALGFEGIGGTAPNSETAVTEAELTDLQDTQSDAAGKVEQLDAELAGLLTRAGPLTPEQTAGFIEAFRTDPDHADAYEQFFAANEALADYVSTNQEAILDASVRNPDVAARTADTIATLSQTGYGVEALEILGEIHGDPDSLEAAAFADYPSLADQTLVDASASAAAQLLGQYDGDTQATNQAIQELIEPIAAGIPIVRASTDFRLANDFLDQFANGDFSNIEAYARQFENGSSITRALGAAGIVIGSASAIQSGTEGDYLAALEGLATAGEGATRLVAGAANALTDTGRIAQYAGRFRGATGFAARLAPGLGLIANSASLAHSVQEAIDGNPGYAVAAFGDTIAVLGSAIELIPGGQPVGFLISGLGVLISTIGSVAGEIFNNGQRAEEIEGYLIEAGVSEDIAHDMARSGQTLADTAERLDLSPEQAQQLALDNPQIGRNGTDLSIFTDAAEAFGLTGQDALGFAAALSEESDDPAGDLLIWNADATFYRPTNTADGQALALREVVAEHFPDALEYIQDVAPEQFGAAAEARDLAIQDFEGALGASFDLAPSLFTSSLQNNTDPAYQAEFVGLVENYYSLTNWVQKIPNNDATVAATREAIQTAIDAGTIDADNGANALAILDDLY